MQLIKATVICAVLTLTACDSSNDAPINTNGADTGGPLINTVGSNTNGTGTDGTATNTGEPGTTEAGIGSITISTAQAPMLDPLPEVTFTPSSSGSADGGADVATLSADGSDVTATLEASGDDGTIGSSTAGASAGDTGGTTDGGDFASPATADAGTTDAVSDDLAADAGGVAPTDSSIIIDDPFEPQPDFEAGTLTAADYDDQLNPHLYQDYASDYLQRVGGKLDVPYLDLSKRIALHVTDEQGLRYGGSHIDITDANGQILNLEVPSSGITYIYTDIDQLPEQFTIRATGRYGSAVEKLIDLAQVSSGRIDIVIPELTAQADLTQKSNNLDIMFVIDTTGSMGDELSYLQTELTSIITALPNSIVTPNLGLTFYRDIGDEYVVRAHGFNNDIGSVQNTLNNETFDGGGDYPEAMDQALHQAIDANWQQDSHKVLFLIADAPPHGNKMRATWQAAEQARDKNIHIVPVAASGVAEDAEYLMRSIAAFTNSRYLFLTDDSGFGNPHAEPDVDCYAVTQLNNLMIRVINSLISGARQEPTDNEIIRTVGNYNAGVCEPTQFVQ